MEDVLGLDPVLSQMIVISPTEMLLETAVETSKNDQRPLQQIVLVNTEAMAFETGFETTEGKEMVVETPADDPQTIEMAVETSVDDPQDLGGLQDQLNTFIMGQQSVETVRKTKREAKAFQTWLNGQREAEGLPMAKIEPRRLNVLLGSYLLNKRKMNGDEYYAGEVSIEGLVKLIEIEIGVISICGSKPLSSKM